MAYFIGSVEFDDLRGTVKIPQPQHDLETRHGTDGVVVYANGTRGKEFTLESRFYVNTWLAAVNLSNAYQQGPSLNNVNIIRGTENYSTTNWRFIVLDVETVIEPNVSWLGIRGSSQVVLTPAFCVKAQWRLVAVDITVDAGPEPDPETAP